jgi:hypothetical protein
MAAIVARRILLFHVRPQQFAPLTFGMTNLLLQLAFQRGPAWHPIKGAVLFVFVYVKQIHNCKGAYGWFLCNAGPYLQVKTFVQRGAVVVLISDDVRRILTVDGGCARLSPCWVIGFEQLCGLFPTPFLQFVLLFIGLGLSGRARSERNGTSEQEPVARWHLR